MPNHLDIWALSLQFLLKVSRIVGQKTRLMVKDNWHLHISGCSFHQQLLQGGLLLPSLHEEFGWKHPASNQYIELCLLNRQRNCFEVVLTVHQELNWVAASDGGEAVEPVESHVAALFAGPAQDEQEVDKIANILGLQAQLTVVCVQDNTELFARFGSTILEVESLTVGQELSQLTFLVVITNSLQVNIHLALLPSLKNGSHLAAHALTVPSST